MWEDPQAFQGPAAPRAQRAGGPVHEADALVLQRQ